MLNQQKVKKRASKKGWEPTREEFQRMAIKYGAMLKFATEHADDPTGMLSALYHDIIDKYCNLRLELRELKRQNAEQKRMMDILKAALERNSAQPDQCDKFNKPK